jgi:3-hydroxyacyl-CoA dehydrogenase
VNEHLNTALKSKPAPIYTQQFANRITTGNTTDDIKIADVDYRSCCRKVRYQKLVFEQVEKYRKPGTLITSNTSGILFTL